MSPLWCVCLGGSVVSIVHNNSNRVVFRIVECRNDTVSLPFRVQMEQSFVRMWWITISWVQWSAFYKSHVRQGDRNAWWPWHLSLRCDLLSDVITLTILHPVLSQYYVQKQITTLHLFCAHWQVENNFFSVFLRTGVLGVLVWLWFFLSVSNFNRRGRVITLVEMLV